MPTSYMVDAKVKVSYTIHIYTSAVISLAPADNHHTHLLLRKAHRILANESHTLGTEVMSHL